MAKRPVYRVKKFRVDYEMTVRGHRFIESDDEGQAELDAEDWAAGVSCDEFYSSCEVESMPQIETLWVTEEKPKKKRKGPGETMKD